MKTSVSDFPSLSNPIICESETPLSSLRPDDTVRIAYSHARRLGLTRDDAYECALDFRLHLLRCENPQTDNEAWIHRCAKNFACNTLRSKIRRQQREREYESGEHLKQVSHFSPVLREAGPRTITLRKSLWIQLAQTLSEFTPEQQDLFQRFHFQQQPLSEISRQTGRSAHSLTQSLHNIHRRLARLLLAKGWTPEEAKQLYANSQMPALVRSHL